MSRTKPVILLSVPNLGLGGAQRQTVNITNGLCRKGFKCMIFAFRGGELEKETDSRVRVITPCFPPFVKRSGFLSFICGMLSFVRTLLREKPDIMYSRHWPKISNTLLGKILGIKTVWTEGNSARFLRKSHPVRFFLHKLCAPRADRVTVNSKGLAEECREYLDLKSEPDVIYNGTDTDLIRLKSKEDADHSWVKNKTLPVVVSVGRLVEQKGFETLIDTFAVLNKSIKARLLIIGDGRLKPVLLKKIKRLGLEDVISLTGWKENPYPLIANADLYVSSSVHEGLVNSLLEAQALGVPVVSTDHPFGANEIIQDGINGILVPVGDVQAMAEAILKIMNSRSAAQKISRAAQKQAESFSIERMSGEYADLFEQIFHNQ